eukprot:8909027-Lingulodinium_polyedra.AAC.1
MDPGGTIKCTQPGAETLTPTSMATAATVALRATEGGAGESGHNYRNHPADTKWDQTSSHKSR